MTFAVMIVCLIIWSVLGAIFWIPLLVRVTGFFVVALVHSTFTGGSVEQAGAALHIAIDFYFRGFRLAYRIFEDSPNSETVPHVPHISFSWMRLLQEGVWACFIWYLILAVIGVTPGFIEIFDSLSSTLLRIQEST